MLLFDNFGLLSESNPKLVKIEIENIHTLSILRKKHIRKAFEKLLKKA